MWSGRVSPERRKRTSSSETDMDIGEQEARRADNQIWNAAGAYGFATGSRGYEPNGEASLYFNTAIGLVRRLYDYRKLEILLTALERRSSGEMQSELLWLGLERCAYLKYRDSRPALTFLRRDYAQRQLQQEASTNSEQDRLKIGWFRRALGLPSEETGREKQILDALEFDPDWDAEAIQSRMERILYKYFGRNLRSEMDHLGTSRVDLGFFAKLILRPGGLNRLGQAAPEGGVGLRALSRRIFGWREARKDDLRQYAAACFGKSMLTPAELADAERVCCTGHHRGCVLHFTRGEAPENGEAPTREWEQLQEQAERNRAYFRAHLAQNRLEIQRLAQQLQNTILLLQEDGSLRCRAGRVDPALAWRAPSLGDGRVFARQQPNTLGDLVVDILLDASASQNRRQEQLATQGYILAEALTRCAIPVRVLSYCSVSGCTVLREYRDYRENQGNDRIFAFAAAGWNRDGLALRAVDWLLRRAGEQQRLLLVLTDANPNDDTRLPGTGNQVFSRDYSGKPAVADAAEEATALRRHGNPPLCLFSGREGDLSSARAIYGRDVVRLPSMGWFAQTVGKIIQGRLQALES
ncbi:MAG: hypothetical protein EGQ46_02230 [Clostridiales bacterium]|nr:hypothetical protein [Clostridiales bacterium]